MVKYLAAALDLPPNRTVRKLKSYSRIRFQSDTGNLQTWLSEPGVIPTCSLSFHSLLNSLLVWVAEHSNHSKLQI